ncbi:DUF1932 domain-containing protein [Roseibium sp.]|uniref:DUF1932 domain-containing protein n=1 Tax=Roseibium sp. TaxID=1936156 RepID=UPI003A985044
MQIAFIGFGEAAQAFAETLGRNEPDLSIMAYDILLEEASDHPGRQGIVEAASRLGIGLGANAPMTAANADWVFSAVTAGSSTAAATSVAGSLRAGSVYFDINSVAARRKQDCAQLIAVGGVTYIDMAVMAPVHPRGHLTPVLIAGDLPHATEEQLAKLGFRYDLAGSAVGRATSIKMVRSLFVKGQEAITVQCLLAAKAAGCLDEVRQSLEASFPELGWPDFATYRFERVARHGKRRAEEMRESAATMGDLGYAAGARLAAAVADIQDEVAALGLSGSVLEGPLEEILEEIPVPEA